MKKSGGVRLRTIGAFFFNQVPYPDFEKSGEGYAFGIFADFFAEVLIEKRAGIFYFLRHGGREAE